MIKISVYLTKSGGKEFAIMKLEKCDKLQATVKLIAHLEEGEKSSREKGWLSSEDIETTLGLDAELKQESN